MMAITDWPAAERPREKLLHKGAMALSDAELLAIFLRTGVKGKTAVDLSRDLLLSFGGLRDLLKADQSAFCAADGLGPAKFALLQAVLEMSRRHLDAQLRRGDPLSNPDNTRNFLISKLRDYEYEVFGVLLLDNRHRVIRWEEIFRGTIDGASVHPREVIKIALKENAAAVIFAHNHPSGVTDPSASDKHLTQSLIQALGMLDIRVLDHFIIGDGKGYSFAEHGLI